MRADDGEPTGVADLALTVVIIAQVGAAEPAESKRSCPHRSSPRRGVTTSSSPVATLKRPCHSMTCALSTSTSRSSTATSRRLTPWTSPTAPDTWDFTYIDRMLNPIFTAGDHSPLYQIAMGPLVHVQPQPRVNSATRHIRSSPSTASTLVKYYNTGGFTDGGGILPRLQPSVGPSLTGASTTSPTSTASRPTST